mmetsp:Transcript_56140/g.126905  ORF Transcript_56140/g.126905 Transcript_56140/m.126905 type:complete len:231 (-) Transcript_56140:731-1423(-)
MSPPLALPPSPSTPPPPSPPVVQYSPPPHRVGPTNSPQTPLPPCRGALPNFPTTPLLPCLHPLRSCRHPVTLHSQPAVPPLAGPGSPAIPANERSRGASRASPASPTWKTPSPVAPCAGLACPRLRRQRSLSWPTEGPLACSLSHCAPNATRASTCLRHDSCTGSCPRYALEAIACTPPPPSPPRGGPRDAARGRAHRPPSLPGPPAPCPQWRSCTASSADTSAMSPRRV